MVDRVDAAQIITELVYEYLERRLGRLLYFARISVNFREDSTEVDVEVDASPLVDDEVLNKVVDEAAEFGIRVGDVVRELMGSALSLEELREAVRRRIEHGSG